VAWRQANEARRLREEQARPFVIIDFHPWSTIIELKIKNVGTTLARNVKFEFNPAMSTTLDDTPGRGPIMDMNLFRNGIPSLAPGKEITILFDRFPTRVEQNLPLTYDVRVSYTDNSGTPWSEPTVLDLAMYLGTGGITRHDIHDVHKRLEEIVREIRKWTFSGGGVKVMDREDIKAHNEEMEAWYQERERLEAQAERQADAATDTAGAGAEGVAGE
jgi:hypothetical protein